MAAPAPQGDVTRRSDGKSVTAVVPTGQTWPMGKPVYVDQYHGVTLAAAEAGEAVAVEIEQSVHELTVPSTVAAAKGDLVYITTDGNHTLSASASGTRLFGRVWRARDSNNVAWIRLAAQ